jgi:hypothetical protein
MGAESVLCGGWGSLVGSVAQELANVPGPTNLRSPALRDALFLIEQSVIADEK